MTVSLKHKFNNAKADGADATVVRPSNWNDEHDLTLATNTLLGRATAGTGAAEEITCTAAGRALIDDADAAAQRATLSAETLGEVAAINTQVASYTLVIGDKGKVVEINNASANTLTIPPNASVAFPVKTYINVLQYGAGQITITAGAGVTIRSRNGLKLGGQYAVASLYQRATDEWVVGGDVTT